MSLIDSRHIVLPLSCALFFTLGNKDCDAFKPPGGGGGGMGTIDAGQGTVEDAGSKTDAALADAGDDSDDDAGGGALVCGTRGAESCAGGEFCNFEPDRDCGDSDRGGHCEEIPEICTAIFDPVCGCDLRSYSSACNAHGNAVSVRRRGLCTAGDCTDAGGRPLFSDGASDPSCPDGEEQWSIGGVDEPAVCCVAAASDNTCGGIASLSCASTEFCNYESAAGGQGCDGSIADAAGVCEARPEFCTDEYAPVCGCDRRSYGNACVAHAAGTAVLHRDRCTEIDCAAAGGHPVDGIGPGPMCPAGELEYTWIGYSNGATAIEGTACCVPE
jgi:hypothetical protein